MAFERSIVKEIILAVGRKTPLLQVIVGPRQVGKTTAARQIVDRLKWPAHIASADAPTPHDARRIPSVVGDRVSCFGIRPFVEGASS